MGEPRYKFGGFVFDAQRRVLQHDGIVVPLPNKASELLCLLLSEAGKPVSKERIYEAVWGEKIVEEGNLTQTMYVLRRALSNGSSGRTMIRTIPQLGYAFVEPVTVAPETSRRPLRIRVISAVACALAVLLSYAHTRNGKPKARQMRRRSCPRRRSKLTNSRAKPGITPLANPPCEPAHNS
jgi:DNA-binding winged helix-turn-helix (wHTH) protein